MNIDLNSLIRPNIRTLTPYSSARDEFKGEASIFLDANENSFGSPLTKWYNRYPDPLQLKVKHKLSEIKGIPVPQMFLGNGSDECIDILIRAFCEPAIDNMIICPPTYGMYEVSANINNVEVKKVPLTPSYQLDLERLDEAIDGSTKMIFLCSPNNPTGNSLNREDVEALLNNYYGIVVIDEAYINFSRYRSFTQELNEYPNLVVMQTLSKAWGLAGLRLGMAFASKAIIDLMNKVKYPYNINSATQLLALEALDNIEWVNEHIATTVIERETLKNELSGLSFTEIVYPSDANFLLAKMKNAKQIYEQLCEKGIIVRDRSKVTLCEDSLRITIGTPDENKQLLDALNNL